MRCGRQSAAVLGLVALLTPLGSGAAAALHLAAAHAFHHHDDEAADLRAVWHGHSHDKSTPEHDHLVIKAPTPAARLSVMRLESPSSFQLVDYAACRACAEQRLARSFAPGRTGAGPPPPSSERQAILRV